MEILHTGLHTIFEKLVERICLKIKAYFLEVIILLILITFLLDYILMLCEAKIDVDHSWDLKRNCCKFQQFLGKQYKRAKAPIELMLHMQLLVTQSLKTA